jgi:hypothetical protein
MHSSSSSAAGENLYAIPGFGKPLNHLPGTIEDNRRHGAYFMRAEGSDGKELFPNALNTFHLDYGLTQ